MKPLKNIHKTFSIGLCLALFALASTGSAAYAQLENVSLRYTIEKPKKMDLHYDVYAGGFKAMNAELEMDLDKKAYDMSLKAETQGFVGGLFPWKGTFETSGQSKKGVLVPTSHVASTSWRKNISTTEISYDPKGRAIKTTVQESDGTKTNRTIDKDLAQNSVDLLTGTLLVMQAAKANDKCAGSFPVFDGRRRFNLVLKDEGKEVLPASRHSKFSGEALKCSIKVDPVKGFKGKDKKRGWMAIQEHTEARRMPPTLWLARLDNKGPLVPVRMEISSEYGSVVAHLSPK